jgi:hypothetical protein
MLIEDFGEFDSSVSAVVQIGRLAWATGEQLAFSCREAIEQLAWHTALG